MDNEPCPTCRKKLQRHSVKIICIFCRYTYHIDCLPLTRADLVNINKDQWTCVNCLSDIFPFNHVDDENDYLTYLSELWFSQGVDFETLNNRVLSLFQTNHEESNYPLFQCDADYHFFRNMDDKCPLSDSPYFIEDSFNKMVKENH